jgi:hypothetical protein
MEPKFGDLVTLIGSNEPWMVLGLVTNTFTFVDDAGEEHDYKADFHYACIRFGEGDRWQPGMTMGMSSVGLRPYMKLED